MQGMTTVFKVQDEVNPRMTLEATGFRGRGQARTTTCSSPRSCRRRSPAARATSAAAAPSSSPPAGTPAAAPRTSSSSASPRSSRTSGGRTTPRWRPTAFDRLLADMRAHVRGSELFVQDLYAGADPAYRLNVRVITELAWHGLFIRHLLRRPDARGTRRLRARLHHPELPELPRRPGPARLPLRDRHRHLLRAEADPDRRHRLRRREQEERLHRSSTTSCPSRG